MERPFWENSSGVRSKEREVQDVCRKLGECGLGLALMSVFLAARVDLPQSSFSWGLGRWRILQFEP